jgi:hypothetical protein
VIVKSCSGAATALIIVTSLCCTDIGDPAPQARITVHIHWDSTPIAGKKVEVLQTGEVKYSDQNGIADFNVRPGSYTIRVYGINRGGPTLLSVDFDVTVEEAGSKTLDVVDCLPCV